MFLRRCLIHKSIIILKDFLYLLYLYLCQYLGLFLLYLCDVFHFHLHFHDDYLYNLMNTDMHVLLLIFRSMLYYFWMTMWMKNVNNFQIAKVQPQGVA